MVSTQYSNAMAETLYYLKGIRKEDIDKIPKKFIKYLEENASKDYKCSFDYNMPLSQLQLLPETRGFIGTIALNYWCTTNEQKETCKKRLKENENNYQNELREKYNPDNALKDISQVVYQGSNTLALTPAKESFFTKIKNWFKGLFRK